MSFIELQTQFYDLARHHGMNCAEANTYAQTRARGEWADYCKQQDAAVMAIDQTLPYVAPEMLKALDDAAPYEQKNGATGFIVSAVIVVAGLMFNAGWLAAFGAFCFMACWAPHMKNGYGSRGSPR